MIPGDLSDGKENYKNGIFGFQTATKGSSKDLATQMLEYSPSINARVTAEKINAIQKFFLEETRLGIPIIPYDEALHGLVREGATAFPQSIGLAATWDTVLLNNVYGIIAKEVAARGLRQVLSPVVNLARDVRWGRTEETYGEDPFLSARAGICFTRNMEQAGVITTPKHFVANVGAGGRDSYPIQFNERMMREVYFPAFEACFKEGGATSVMTSYNSLDGTPCTSNAWLLRKILKEEWGFDGFVISDAGATGGSTVLHMTDLDYTAATVSGLNGGLDVMFQTSYSHYPLFQDAFNKNLIGEDVIDEAVSRVLRAKFKLGLFEGSLCRSGRGKK